MSPNHIQPGGYLSGIEPDRVVQVVAVMVLGDSAWTLIYRLPDGTIRERLLSAADFATISPATTERPWSFDGDGTAFKLAVEVKRIDLAFPFDPMMAVQTSNVDPLPHQVSQPCPFLSRC